MNEANNINYLLNVVIDYALSRKLIDEYDSDYYLNLLLNFFNLSEVKREKTSNDASIFDALLKLYDLKKEEYNYPDFITAVLNILTPLPSVVNDNFQRLIEIDSKKASDYLYKISTDSLYINTENLKKDIKWKVDSKYGKVDITINLSKPEKDPRDILKAKQMPSSNYPLCMLCKENMGYKGRPSYPSKLNLRFVKVDIDSGETYYMQYSPYSYFNQHLIVFNKKHIPMVVNKNTFSHLLNFVDEFPHYFLGSNADLPIVGGSILSHDHYQGGDKILPMFAATDAFKIEFSNHNDVHASYLNWPLSVIRLKSNNKESLIELADDILNAFIKFEDNDNEIYAFTNGERHNTITPIAHKDGELFVLDLALRNNYSNENYPLGLYHPHSEYWCIKKENIGLIEVLGLAILPRRLKDTLLAIEDDINNNVDISTDEKVKEHYSWIKNIDLSNKSDLDNKLKEEIGHTYVKILECCKIFKTDKQAQESINKIKTLMK